MVGKGYTRLAMPPLFITVGVLLLLVIHEIINLKAETSDDA